MQPSFVGLFPKDSLKNTRFAINFWTAVGLGGLTDGLREHLKDAPKRSDPQSAVLITQSAELHSGSHSTSLKSGSSSPSFAASSSGSNSAS